MGEHPDEFSPFLVRSVLLEAELLSVVSVDAGEPFKGGTILSNFPVCPASSPPGADQFLKRPVMGKKFASSYTHLANTYRRVLQRGVPNYRGARIQLDHKLNIPEWRSAGHLFRDKSLPDMLAYGFPSGHMGQTKPVTGLSNHASSLRNPVQVDKFLKKECRLDAIAGPFNDQPFEEWFRCNPLMTRPKRDSQDLRVILDLSFPVGQGVNGG